MPKFYLHIFFFVACSGCLVNVTAQNADSILLLQSVAYAKAAQKKVLADNLRLYNGTSYSNSYSGAKGFPFFNSDTLQPGSVFYDGALYDSVPMFYDLTTDDLIIASYNRQYNIKLHKEKIAYFLLSGHLFVLQEESLQNATIKAGFYDLIYKNKSEVYVRREKILRQQAKLEGIESRFADYIYYFIKINERFYRIQTAADLQEVFKDKAKLLKNYLRTNGFSFKKDAETTLVKAATYYDSLTN